MGRFLVLTGRCWIYPSPVVLEPWDEEEEETLGCGKRGEDEEEIEEVPLGLGKGATMEDASKGEKDRTEATSSWMVPSVEGTNGRVV